MNPNQTDPLAGLRDIHLPEAISFWPLAPGWWIAFALVVAIAIATHLLLAARSRSLKPAALKELEGIEARYQADASVSGLALRLSILLRRVALTRYGQREVASLAGDDWSDFLMRTGRRLGITSEHAHGLVEAIYAGPHARGDESAPGHWIHATRRWIRGNA